MRKLWLFLSMGVVTLVVAAWPVLATVAANYSCCPHCPVYK
jgi:hypothetical protein